MTVAQLFNREFVLEVGSLRFATVDVAGAPKTNLRIVFNVEKNLTRDPNTATVQLYNARELHRKQIETEVGEQRSVMSIEAGYTNAVRQVYVGDVTTITNRRERVDWVTTIESGDKRNVLTSKRISQSFTPAESNYRNLLPRLAEGFGVGLDSLTKQLNKGEFRGGLAGFAKGFVASGKLSDEFEKAMTAAGLEWSIQDGEMRVLRPGEGIGQQGSIPTLEAAQGLIGSPEGGEKGIVTAQSLLRSDILVGDLVKLIARGAENERFTGNIYRVQSLVHSGDTWGDAWTTSFELEPEISTRALPAAITVPGDRAFA